MEKGREENVTLAAKVRAAKLGQNSRGDTDRPVNDREVEGSRGGSGGGSVMISATITAAATATDAVDEGRGSGGAGDSRVHVLNCITELLLLLQKMLPPP